MKKARIAAGLSQAALARSADVAQAQLSQIEAATRVDPQFSTVAKLASALGLSLDQIAFEIGLREGHIPIPQDLSIAELVGALETCRNAERSAKAVSETLDDLSAKIETLLRRPRR